MSTLLTLSLVLSSLNERSHFVHSSSSFLVLIQTFRIRRESDVVGGPERDVGRREGGTVNNVEEPREDDVGKREVRKKGGFRPFSL